MAVMGTQNFPEYYSEAQLLETHVVPGWLNVNPKFPSNAYVRVSAPYMLPYDDSLPECCYSDAMNYDIFIKGSVNRNRAIHGDTVYVEILPISQWEYDNGMQQDHRAAMNDTDTPDDDEGLIDNATTLRGRGLPGLPCGRVVYLLKRCEAPILAVIRNQQCSPSHTIDDELRIDPKSQRLRAISIDKRHPWVLIDAKRFLSEYDSVLVKTVVDDNTSAAAGNNASSGAVKVLRTLPEYTIFVVKVTEWLCKDKLPKGILLGVKGDCLNVDTEIEICLSMNDIEGWSDPISKEVEEWAATRVKEIKDNFDEIAAKRKDLRHLNVITIDPSTARDLDDAIHIRTLTDQEVQERYERAPRASGEPGGRTQSQHRAKKVVEVGVHIADVSFVIDHKTPADLEAKNRTTTVYLPNRAFHMLPRCICQELCSLDNSSGDKLAFSVLAYFSQAADGSYHLINNGLEWKGGIWAPQFLKTVITNDCRLNYDEVQDVLQSEFTPTQLSVSDKAPDDGGDRHFCNLIELVSVAGAKSRIETSARYSMKKLKEDLKKLFLVARSLRSRRFESGSADLSSLQMRFECDTVDGRPISIREEIHTASHWLIEELMLLANQLVAQRIYASGAPGRQLTLLRTHPRILKMKKLIDALKDVGCSSNGENFSSAGNLVKFLQEVRRSNSSCRAMMIEQIVIMHLEQAIYQWSGSEKCKDTWHFALGFQYYTHFTSPIRRYADLLVHRQLDAVLNTKDEEALELELRERCHIPDLKNKKNAEEDDVLERANDIRIKAKRAGDRAAIAWLLMFLLAQPKPMTSVGIVTEVCDKSFMVYVPDILSSKRVEFETARRAGGPSKGTGVRLLRKVRPEHLKQIDLPTIYTLFGEGGAAALAQCESDIERRNLYRKCNVRIQWESGATAEVKFGDELQVWVLPSRDLPLSVVLLPVPPTFKETGNNIASGVAAMSPVTHAAAAAIIRTLDTPPADDDEF